MIFVVNSSGNIVGSKPETIYQGSSGANAIYLIDPNLSHTVVTAVFTLPNGVTLDVETLAKNGEFDVDGKTLTGWSLNLPALVTKYYGVVTVQFFFYSSSNTITATTSTTFRVARGVPDNLPEIDEDTTGAAVLELYADILSTLAAINDRVDSFSFHQCTAETSGEDTTSIAVSDLDISTTDIVQVGDYVVTASNDVYRVTALDDEDNPTTATVEYLMNINGTSVYPANYERRGMPYIDNYYTISDYFGNPLVGEYLAILWTDTSTDISYFVTAEVTAKENGVLTFQVIGYTRLTGETGNGISTIAKTGTDGLIDTYTITFTDGTTSEFTITNGATPTVTNVNLDGTAYEDGDTIDVDVTVTVKQGNWTATVDDEGNYDTDTAEDGTTVIYSGGVTYTVTATIAEAQANDTTVTATVKFANVQSSAYEQSGNLYYDTVDITRNVTITIPAGETSASITGSYQAVSDSTATSSSTATASVTSSSATTIAAEYVATYTATYESGDTDTFTLTGTTKPLTESEVEEIADTKIAELKTQTGATLKLELNNSTFVITATLIAADGETVLSEQSIDLPLESVVVNGEYDTDSKKVILILQNGNSVEFSVADLVDGLASSDDLDSLSDTVSNKLDTPYHVNLGSATSGYTSGDNAIGSEDYASLAADAFSYVIVNSRILQKVSAASDALTLTFTAVYNSILYTVIIDGDYNSWTYTQTSLQSAVTVNPELDGTEEELTSITINGTKYKVASTSVSVTTETDSDGDTVLVLSGVTASTTTDSDGNTVLVLS